MWFTETKPIDFLDRKRMVTLNVGQLVDAIAEALRVVEDAPTEPQWKPGDRAYIEVEVTKRCGKSVLTRVVGWPETAQVFAFDTELLQEIE